MPSSSVIKRQRGSLVSLPHLSESDPDSPTSPPPPPPPRIASHLLMTQALAISTFSLLLKKFFALCNAISSAEGRSSPSLVPSTSRHRAPLLPPPPQPRCLKSPLTPLSSTLCCVEEAGREVQPGSYDRFAMPMMIAGGAQLPANTAKRRNKSCRKYTWDSEGGVKESVMAYVCAIASQWDGLDG